MQHRRSWKWWEANVTIEQAVRKMLAIPDGWIRLDSVARMQRGLDLQFGVYKGKRGRTMESYLVHSKGVRDVMLVDFDGGGIQVYSSKHTAALQFGEQAELRFRAHLPMCAAVQSS
jgi:hypothetical protein